MQDGPTRPGLRCRTLCPAPGHRLGPAGPTEVRARQGGEAFPVEKGDAPVAHGDEAFTLQVSEHPRHAGAAAPSMSAMVLLGEEDVRLAFEFVREQGCRLGVEIPGQKLRARWRTVGAWTHRVEERRT